MTPKPLNVAEVIAKELNVESSAIHSTTPLDSLGMDSLELVSLLQSVEEQFGPIPHIAFETVGDIEQALRG